MINIFKWFCRSKSHQPDEGMNVVPGISKAKSLYKNLIVRAHPDKHSNDMECAQSMTERLNNCRYNYSELLKIEKLIDEKGW